MNQKATAAGLLAAVFFAGVVTTLGVVRIMNLPNTVVEASSEEQSSRWRRGDRRGPPLALSHITERLYEELGLDEEQRDQIETIMARRREATAAIMRELEPRLRTHMDSLDLEIADVLSEDQLKAFKDLRQDERERFRRRGSGRRGAPARGNRRGFR